MTGELVDLVNERDEIIGTAHKTEAHKNRLLHRLAVVFIFYNGKLLVQKRTAQKNGLLDHSVGGHVARGESYEQAARREMLEELGLAVPIRFVGKLMGRAKPAGGEMRISHFLGIFEAAVDDEQFGSIQPDAREIEELILFSPEALSQKMRAEPDVFAGGFLGTFDFLLRHRS